MIGLGDIPGNGETQARALLLFIKPYATLAQCDELILRDAGSIVFDYNEDSVVTFGHGHGDRRTGPFGRVLQNVAEEFAEIIEDELRRLGK